MKKIFPLESSSHKPARLAEKVKGEVRKYLKRERRKPLPEDVDFWDFDCRVGTSPEDAAKVHEKEIGKAVDTALEAGKPSVYLEILAKEGRRRTKE